MFSVGDRRGVGRVRHSGAGAFGPVLGEANDGISPGGVNLSVHLVSLRVLTIGEDLVCEGTRLVFLFLGFSSAALGLLAVDGDLFLSGGNLLIAGVHLAFTVADSGAPVLLNSCLALNPDLVGILLLQAVQEFSGDLAHVGSELVAARGSLVLDGANLGQGSNSIVLPLALDLSPVLVLGVTTFILNIGIVTGLFSRALSVDLGLKLLANVLTGFLPHRLTVIPTIEDNLAHLGFLALGVLLRRLGF